ncbi:MAG: HEAT repeat domain-containing protein [Synergistetes bacterium]|nr:HEAT repeat domain-containing protein [Synergistota bacterium]MDW8193172.1 HEAT repeat domain-containing protein [Synergistota bacterium]
MPIRRKDSEGEGIKPDFERRKYSRDFEGLIQQLESSVPMERRWAARDLSKYREASPYLANRLRREEDLSVREVIVTSLLEIGDEVALKELLECLRSDDAHLRNLAIDALKNVPEKVAPYIDMLLEDPDPDVRIFTVNIIGNLAHPRVIEWLVKVLEKDPHVNVCATALDVLSEIGTEDSLPVVIKVKERFKDEPYIQFVANIVIERIKGNG